MKTIRLYRIGLFSTFRFGLVLGLILNFLPTMMITFLVLWGTSLVVRWLANLSSALPLPGGFAVPVSVIELLGLQDLLRALEVIASLAAWQIAGLSVLLWLASALISGILALIVVAVFNIIAQMAGGVEVSVDEADFLAGAAPGELASSYPVAQYPMAQYPVAQYPVAPTYSSDQAARTTPAGELTGPSSRPVTQQGPYFEVFAPQRRILPVRPPGVVIGSEPSAGIILGGLAPRHAQVVFERGRILLVDLGGGNLWVRERPAEQVNLLEDGTLVQIGPWQMIFRFPRG